jgi:IS66 Orf2 like protein
VSASLLAFSIVYEPSSDHPTKCSISRGGLDSSGSDWDGTGLCRFTKRLEQGVFLWPPDVHPGETPALTLEQLSMLIDGVDWRAPERRWRLTNRQCMARDHQFLVGRNNVKRNTAVGRRYA